MFLLVSNSFNDISFNRYLLKNASSSLFKSSLVFMNLRDVRCSIGSSLFTFSFCIISSFRHSDILGDFLILFISSISFGCISSADVFIILFLFIFSSAVIILFDSDFI